MYKKETIIKLLSGLFVVLLCLSIVSVARAHSASQAGILAKSYISNPNGGGGYYIGGEEVGWSIDEDYHTNGTYITYSFDYSDINLTDYYRDIVNTGAQLWQGIVTIHNKLDGSGTGLIKTSYSPGIPVAAFFTDYVGNANNMGHLTSWSIVINRAKPVNSCVIAHEFGHVIGLNDLYGSNNSNKLMYGFTTGGATAPTASDIWGAKVITGVHAAHSWGYKFYNYSGGNNHIKYCTSCKGLTNTIEACSYNSNNVCIKCGIPEGYQPWNVEGEIE